MTENIHAEAPGHGTSPAAWATVITMIVGAAIASVFFCLANAVGFWAGVAVMALGLVIGGVLRAAGFGVNGSRVRSSHSH